MQLMWSERGPCLWAATTTVNQILKIRNLPDDIKEDSIVLDTPKSILIELSKLKDKKTVSRLWKRSKGWTDRKASLR